MNIIKFINFIQSDIFASFSILINGVKILQFTSEESQLSQSQQTAYWIVSVLLLILASFCSGSNIGLLGVDPVQFETIRREGNEKEQKACNRLRFFMKNRHLTLCSILIINAFCMEILPILLTSLLGELLSLILSVTLIMLFGELIPQSIFNKNGIIICGMLHWVLWIFVVLTFIISKPLALLLDKILGSNQAHFLQRREIAAFCMQHANNRDSIQDISEDQSQNEEGKVLYKQEAEQLNRLIYLKDLTVDNLQWMVPFDKVYTVSSDTIVTKEFLNSLIQVKFSRYPVYKDDKRNIIGTLHIKSLFKMQIDQPLDLSLLHPTLTFKNDLAFFDAFEQFQTGKNHLAIVQNQDKMPIGIVTLESLLQKLIVLNDEQQYQ